MGSRRTWGSRRQISLSPRRFVNDRWLFGTGGDRTHGLSRHAKGIPIPDHRFDDLQPCRCLTQVPLASRFDPMPWIFHTSYGAGKVRSRKGATARADFGGETLTLSDDFRTVPDDSSWVLASRNPRRLLEVLRDDPQWIVHEQLEDACGELTARDIMEHLSLLGLTPGTIKEWRSALDGPANGSDNERTLGDEGDLVFTPDEEDSKNLRIRLISALGILAFDGSTVEERGQATLRLSNLSSRTPVDPGDAALARILGCAGFEDPTPLPKIKLGSVGKEFLSNMIGCCDRAEDLATLILIAPTTNEARLTAKELTDGDKARLERLFVGLLDEFGRLRPFKEHPERAPTDAEVTRMVGRIALMAGTVSGPVVDAMLRTRVAAAKADKRALVNAVDKSVKDVRPTIEALRSAASSTSDLSAQARASCLNSLSFRPDSIRVQYLEALLRTAGTEILDRPEPWEKVTTLELASGWPDDCIVLTAMVNTKNGRQSATKAIRKEIDRMDAVRLGLVLGLRPDVRKLIPDELFVKALKRLMQRNPNVSQLRELVAQPVMDAWRRELDQEKSVLEDHHSELEADFRTTISERDDRIAVLESALGQTKARIASHSTEVRGASNAELRQAKIDALRGCAKMVRDLQSEQGNEEVLGKLESALKAVGLVVMDQPGEVVTFEPSRHERLVEGASPQVEVVLSAIGFTEDRTTTIIEKGLVRNNG